MLLAIVEILFYLFVSYTMMKLYNKAGLENTWFAFIPILNIIILLQAIGKSGWNILWMLVPIANIVFAIMWYYDFAKSFGRHGGHIVGWILVPLYMQIHCAIMAFSDDVKYEGVRR